MRADVLVLIPASLHGHGVPRQPLRTLGGRPLLLHTIQAALSLVTRRERVVVVADDDEIALLAERQGIETRHVPAADDAAALIRVAREYLHRTRETAEAVSAVMVLRPVSPLLQPGDLDDAVARLIALGCDSVQSACANPIAGRPPVFAPAASPAAGPAASLPTETFIVSRPAVLSTGTFVGSTHDFAILPAERGLEIRSTRDWWVCERLFERRRIVFVVIGDTSVGLGHVYRATLVAEEFADHDVSFVCPTGNDLAVGLLAKQMLPVHMPGDRDLADAVLALQPDLVVNDVLTTDREYVERLRAGGARVVNFEDLGTGALAADLVINDIYQETSAPPNHRNGPSYYCIRDEFLHAVPQAPQDDVREVLITFGGTDAPDSTLRVARLIVPVAAARGIHLSLVTGSGYLHLDRLREFLASVPGDVAELANGTKRMSEYMEHSDLAFSSAGRTVFELAAMRVPAIILASNPREETHTFAAPENGFVYLGRADAVADAEILAAFTQLVDSPLERRTMKARMRRWDFRDGRARVLAAIQPLLAAGREQTR